MNQQLIHQTYFEKIIGYFGIYFKINDQVYVAHDLKGYRISWSLN